MRFSTFLLVSALQLTGAFFVVPSPSSRTTAVLRGTNDDSNSEADRLKQQAEELREQIRRMEEKLGNERKRNYDPPPAAAPEEATVVGKTLRKKRVLVAGANGRLGSMVCRYLLRNHPETEVVACVHYVGEDSPTARGYGRLSYEVGAEDGVGSIGAAWSAEDRTATFEYDASVMAGYNLQNLRLVECELLDPVQCQTVVGGCDSVIWCATDFNGNTPRAVSGLNFAFLFRAVANPTKGRVEVEGLQNMMGALKNAQQESKWKKSVLGESKSTSSSSDNNPINFVHVSIVPKTFMNSETPFGSFWGIKERSEEVVREDFPSLTTTILQFGQFDDAFVEEGQELITEEARLRKEASSEEGESTYEEPPLRKINRRDAARAAVDALLNDEFEGKTIQIWTKSSR